MLYCVNNKGLESFLWSEYVTKNRGNPYRINQFYRSQIQINPNFNMVSNLSKISSVTFCCCCCCCCKLCTLRAQLWRLITRALWDSNGRQALPNSFNVVVCSRLDHILNITSKHVRAGLRL